MIFKIVPCVGVNNIKFCDSRSNVNSQFQSPVTSLQSQPWDVSLTDYYDEFGIRFSYVDEQLDSIGFAPETNLELLGKKISSSNKLKSLLKDLKKVGYLHQQYDDAFYYDDLGFCVFSGNGKKIDAFELYQGKYIDRAEKAIELANKHFDL